MFFFSKATLGGEAWGKFIQTTSLETTLKFLSTGEKGYIKMARNSKCLNDEKVKV